MIGWKFKSGLTDKNLEWLEGTTKAEPLCVSEQQQQLDSIQTGHYSKAVPDNKQLNPFYMTVSEVCIWWPLEEHHSAVYGQWILMQAFGWTEMTHSSVKVVRNGPSWTDSIVHSRLYRIKNTHV